MSRVGTTAATTGTAAGRAARFSRRDVDVEGAAVSVVVGPPTGPGMVLVHGLAARWQVFGPLMTRWSPAWTVAALDLPGHGGSARAPHLYSVAGYAAAVQGALDVVAAARRPQGPCSGEVPGTTGEPAVLVGHSAGGWAALHAAVSRPDRVAALVLVDTPVDAAGLDRLGAAAEVATAPLTLRGLSPSLGQVDPQVLEALRNGDLVGGYLPRRLLPGVRCPVLLLQAAASRGGLMSDADVRTVRALVPDVRHVLVADGGHALPVQTPDAVDAAVRGFLGRLATTYLQPPQRL